MDHINEVERLKALADPTRLRLLSLLTLGELCICDLTEALQQPQSTVSRHMSRLLRAGLVTVEQRAKWRYYMLNNHDTMGWSYLTGFIKSLSDSEPYRSDHHRLRLLSASKPVGVGTVCAKPQIKG